MIGVERAKTSPNRRNVMEMVLLSAPISAKCGSSMAKMHPLPNQGSVVIKKTFGIRPYNLRKRQIEPSNHDSIRLFLKS